jgi:hypothetical protein
MLCPCGWVGLVLTLIVSKIRPRWDVTEQDKPRPSGDSDKLSDVHTQQVRPDPDVFSEQ